MSPLEGALVVDKPAGVTSHDVVARVRRILGERSIGHLGTLDPNATGVLPLLVGRLTRLAQFFQAREKEYEGVIRFGFATDTYDLAGTPQAAPVDRVPTLAEIEAALPAFRGTIRQIPPAFSAKKIAGSRAYELARRNQPVPLSPVEVEVGEFAVLDLVGPELRFRLRCSAGTYVRSLAHDLGAKLGIPAHLGALRRTRVGEFTLEAALTPEELERRARALSPATCLIPATRLLPELPAVVAPPEIAARIRQGRAVNLAEFSRARMIRIFEADESLLAVAARVAGTLFQPKIVFPR